jgi:uncharacterized protein with PQ loop repeat
MDLGEASNPRRIFGWIAVCLSLIYKFPQIIKLYQTEETKGISVHSQVVQASAYFFYITHGLLISDPPVIFLGVTSLLQSIVLIGQYGYYTSKKKGKEEFLTEEGPVTEVDNGGTTPCLAILGNDSV